MNKLILGDCLEKLKDIEDNSVDCIVTSPPYNKGGTSNGKHDNHGIWTKHIHYDTYDDNLSEEEYEDWQISIINECVRVLKPSGSLFYNHKVRRWGSQAHFPNWVFNTNGKFYQMIIWDRGQVCDMNQHYLYPNTELIFWITKDKPKVFKKNSQLQNEVWRINPTDSKIHPASFPEQLVENCLLLTTSEKDLVLDPFMGSGTTGIVSTKLNRDFIGIELSENYFKISCDRIKEIEDYYSIGLEPTDYSKRDKNDRFQSLW